MTKKLSQISALILAAATILTCAVSCSDPADTAAEVTTASTTAEATAETTTSITDTLPKGDYSGYEFTILNSTSNFAYTAMSVEELTGEALYDAIYERNSKVCERLNVSIKEDNDGWSEVVATMKSQIMAGDDGYDIFCDEVHMFTSPAQEHMLIDATTVESIDLEQPWWNQTAMESLQIGDKINFLYGQLHFMLYECYFPVAFNKTILNNNNLDDPYAIVNDGKWTLDAMHEYMAAVSTDINGDGKMTAEDQFGLGMFKHNALGFFIASETPIVEKGADNIPVYNGLTERMTEVYTKITELIFADQNIVLTDGTAGVTKLENSVHTAFNNGKTLFYIEPLGSLKKFRDVDFEIGVIPLPKYDENQEDYYSYIYHGASAVVIPITSSDVERTGTVLENLCAESYLSVMPVYFDVTLDFKYIQDEQSQAMLDIMFENGHCEVARVYDWAGFAQKVVSLTTSGSDKFASSLAALETKLTTAIDTTVTAITGG